MKNELIIFRQLLKPGYFIRKRAGQKHNWALFDDTAYRKLAPILKVDKKDRYTVHRSHVRQLHGKSQFKIEYKQFIKNKSSK